MATPMNLADTSNSPTSSPDLMSNMTFLNLERVEIQTHASVMEKSGDPQDSVFVRYFNNTVSKSDRRNASVNRHVHYLGQFVSAVIV